MKRIEDFVGKIIQGDCLSVMKDIPNNSVDAIVTDPPYGLGFMNKEWDILDKSQFGIKGNEGKNDLKIKKNFNVLPRFNNKGLQQFCFEWATECLRVLKPGGFLLSFGGTRTYHRMVCGIEDAGFEIRDCIMWIYGSGFPKSLDIGKQIDKLQGNKREIVEIKQHAKKDFKDNLYAQDPANKNNKKVFGYGEEEITKGQSEWEGWGTALKPACEPIVVARKPLSEKNVGLNVLKWGVGGINIDGCRIGNETIKSKGGKKGGVAYGDWKKEINEYHQGRFPSNIILDEEAGKMLDEQSGELKSGAMKKYYKYINNGYSLGKPTGSTKQIHESNKGGASRFFYCAKSSKSERNLGCGELDKVRKCNSYSESREGMYKDRNTMLRNNHPTVKPLKLMQYLIRLVSTENAIILDPFVGSGTTAISCIKEHRKYIGIDKDINIARERLNNTEKPLDSHF